MADVELVFKRTRRRPERRVLANRSTVTLSIGATPPSYNNEDVARGAHWSKGRKVKREWQEWIGLALMEQQVPRDVLRVEATAVLYFSTDRRRDPGNFRVVLEKATGDALVEGGWLPDDTGDHFEFGRVQIKAPATALPAPLTLIVLTYYQEEGSHGKRRFRRPPRG